MIADSIGTPPPLNHQPTLTPDPFDRLKTHNTMATLNSNIIPWLIAEYGINYADIDNHRTATAMITHVVVTEQLGGFTERTFAALIADGYRVQQSNFTKSVLKQIGMYCAT